MFRMEWKRMRAIGKTLNVSGDATDVYECEKCGFRTTYKGKCESCHKRAIREQHMEEAMMEIL